MPHIIRSRAPVRISFAGGGTDVSPYTEKFGGTVVNAAINQYAYSTFIERKDGKIILDSLDLNKRIEYKSIDKIKLDGNLDLTKAVILFFQEKIPNFFQKFKGGFEVHTSCEIPPRSGLGSSAAMFASVIGIFNRIAKEHRIDNYEIAELAYFLEREKLKNAGGRQDQYATVFGGINFIEFKGHDFVRVNSLKLKEDYLLELESNLVLINLGARSSSGDIINDQIKNLKDNKSSINATHKTKKLASLVKCSLLQGDFIKFGKLLDKGWQEKKKFSSKISNSELNNIYQKLKDTGAIGGKILGAGGGGHMLLYCKPGKKLHVLQKAIKLNLKHVPFTFDHKGLTTWTINGKYEF